MTIAHQQMAIMRRYFHEFGYDDDVLAPIAIGARKHSLSNGKALMTKSLSLEDYVARRMIAEPLGLLDCCLINDGAGAVVITSEERARDLRQAPVVILGSAMGYSPDSDMFFYRSQAPDYFHTAAVYAAPKAYEQAGVGPKDIDFAEIYDCFTHSVLVQIEDHGFCARGEGPEFIKGGRIELGGELPVNTHGGFLSSHTSSGSTT